MNILILCKANYCRSPVCEKMLKSKLSNDFQVQSRGIIDFFRSSMHKESINYLQSKGYTDLLHNPKKVSKETLNKSNLIFSLDFEVAQFIQNNYPNVVNKMRMYNFLNNKISTIDPIGFNRDKYINIMDNLNLCSDLIAEWINKESENHNVY
tara:strand:- start:661 stop:1116 length:456 start_codon:yes stop_codon:yes gene_type:complete